MTFLAGVIEPRQWDVPVLPEQAWEVPEAAHRHDGDALGPKVATTPTRKRLDGTTVARALDKHYSAQLHKCINPFVFCVADMLPIPGVVRQLFGMATFVVLAPVDA